MAYNVYDGAPVQRTGIVTLSPVYIRRKRISYAVTYPVLPLWARGGPCGHYHISC
jgi:hypothetical protein